jgi:transcriptional regulator with XRE-family HTH domain
MGRPRIVRTVADAVAVLKFRRWASELTQRQVAETSGIGQSRVCAYEADRRRPGVDNLIRWADALDMDVALIPRDTDGR